jgi:hypothetical protein
VYLTTPGGIPPTGYTHIFDSTTGKLVGAGTWGDILRACVSPTSSDMAAGGVFVDPFEGWDCNPDYFVCSGTRAPESVRSMPALTPAPARRWSERQPVIRK